MVNITVEIGISVEIITCVVLRASRTSIETEREGRNTEELVMCDEDGISVEVAAISLGILLAITGVAEISWLVEMLGTGKVESVQFNLFSGIKHTHICINYNYLINNLHGNA